jgi:CarD family transcriptional regulator
MFNVGDVIIYSKHGVCKIDDICEKTCLGVTKDYYILHPIHDSKLTICAPVDNDKLVMLDLIHRDEAEEIVESFRLPGIDWIDISNERAEVYNSTVRKGNRREIANVLNTLMRKKYEADINKKKLYEQELKLLTSIQSILFSELAVSLNTTFEAIFENINGLIAASEEELGFIKDNVKGVEVK